MHINIVVPVYNEQHVLAQTIARISSFTQVHFPDRHEIVIADNASTDSTLDISRQVALTHPHVRVVHLEEKGRGRAVKCVWSQSQADILSYMLGTRCPFPEALALSSSH